MVQDIGHPGIILRTVANGAAKRNLSTESVKSRHLSIYRLGLFHLQQPTTPSTLACPGGANRRPELLQPRGPITTRWLKSRLVSSTTRQLANAILRVRKTVLSERHSQRRSNRALLCEKFVLR